MIDRAFNRVVLFPVVALVLGCALQVSADDPRMPIGILRLNSGDFVAGAFADSDNPDQVAWRSPHFQSPLLFPVSDVQGGFFPNPKNIPIATGEFAIEFDGGDRLFGKITGDDEQSILLNNATYGDLVIARDRVRRVYRWNDGKGVTVVDCGNLQGWSAKPNDTAWKELGGNLQTDVPDATLLKDAGIGQKSRIELEIAWQGVPNFAVALGVDPAQVDTAAAALRIEVWDGQFVAVWEQDDRADLVTLGTVAQWGDQLRLTIDLDQVATKARLFSDRGQELGELDLKFSQRRFYSGVLLQNITGNVALRQMKTSDGELELLPEYSSQGNAPENNAPEQPSGSDRESDDAVLIQLRTIDGISLTGNVGTILSDRVTIHPLGLAGPVTVAGDQVARVSWLGGVTGSSHTLAPGVARMETAGTKLHGRLAEITPGAMPVDLRFEPIGGKAAAIDPSFSGRLVYQDPPPKVDNTPRQAEPQPQRPAGLWGAIVQAFAGGSEQPRASVRRLMYLRTGEVIPCDIQLIDDNGVTFKSAMTEQTVVPLNLVRAVQLLPGTTEPVLDRLKRERLLTVPRMRKNNPPTHLVVAANGDVIRCRLKRLDSQSVEIETRLETIQIDRQVVSQILWLDGVGGEEKTDSEAASTDNHHPVRTIFREGNQMSLVPYGVQGTTVLGRHAFLGSVQVDTNQVRDLLIGDIETESIQGMPYRDWRLADAPEPTLSDDAEDGSRMPGAASPLVGKAAPDFSLDLLDGGRFTLSQQRGKIVVLDFWATWCGPCMQAMPVIEQTVNSFGRDDIILVAVNLQETADPIRATLSRLKLDPKVALDVDGVAAARYQANAIPQTVVIDQQGNVHRLFVGGGAKLGPQLAEAIAQLVSGDARAD